MRNEYEWRTETQRADSRDKLEVTVGRRKLVKGRK